MKKIIMGLFGWLFWGVSAMARGKPDPWDYGANHSNSLGWYWYVIIILGIAIVVIASAWHRAEKELTENLIKRWKDEEEKQKVASPPA